MNLKTSKAFLVIWKILLNLLSISHLFLLRCSIYSAFRQCFNHIQISRHFLNPWSLPNSDFSEYLFCILGKESAKFRFSRHVLDSRPMHLHDSKFLDFLVFDHISMFEKCTWFFKPTLLLNFDILDIVFFYPQESFFCISIQIYFQTFAIASSKFWFSWVFLLLVRCSKWRLFHKLKCSFSTHRTLIAILSNNNNNNNNNNCTTAGANREIVNLMMGLHSKTALFVCLFASLSVLF